MRTIAAEHTDDLLLGGDVQVALREDAFLWAKGSEKTRCGKTKKKKKRAGQRGTEHGLTQMLLQCISNPSAGTFLDMSEFRSDLLPDAVKNLIARMHAFM